MAPSPTVKPTHKPVKAYYSEFRKYAAQDVVHEGALRSAFQNLLDQTGSRHGWTLIPEFHVHRNGKTVIPDGTFRDEYHQQRGYWEAKDSADHLETEIQKKIRKGYPLTNTIFEDTRTAHLYQNGEQTMVADLHEPQAVCDLLNAFFAHTEPAIEDFERAVDEFKERVPDLAKGLVAKIEEAHRDNRPFQEAFESFFELCQASLNPNLRREAVDEMLVQHLLTERLIRKIFDRDDFVSRNVIAAEVEKVITALTSKAFSRHDFLKSLDRFYVAIERAAATIESFSEKQHFLNTVYERFFQGYSVKVADTHGIVYTPQEIVDFMCASVVEVLQQEFGKQLGDPDVFVLDPCTGTGNFIVNLLGRVKKKHLEQFYHKQCFANEVMLLPYYIASLNIEHAYYEQAGKYEPFEGICFVDTLDLAEERQIRMFTEANAERVDRQRNAPITVVIGNPPYNMGQLNENDNNKNRSYPIVDRRVRSTYAKDSDAKLKTKLYDAYVKFFRWAVDRLGDRDGIIAFVSNNSFVDQVAFDGMRRHLEKDFALFYHVDIHGNVRENPSLSGTTHNVFGIQVGVGVTIAVRMASKKGFRLRYVRVPEQWRKEEKLRFLAHVQSTSRIQWSKLNVNASSIWRQSSHLDEFQEFIALAPDGSSADNHVVYSAYFPGVNTARDDVVYDFRPDVLASRVRDFCEKYNSEVDRLRRWEENITDADDFVDYNKVKWSAGLKGHLLRGTYATFRRENIVQAMYRPFTSKSLFYDRVLLDRPSRFDKLRDQDGTSILCVPARGGTKPFHTLVAHRFADFHFTGDTRCIPSATPDDPVGNITDWALKQFQKQYKSKRISKWDTFHYVYGLLHHPGYRERYADNLKRELPRIPFAPDFKAFAEAGRKLAELHLGYEDLDLYELDWIETEDVPLSYRVEKMRLSKDKRSLKVNDSLTLAGIPPETADYRLGNRSALEWVVDQYRIKTDKRSGITSDPNRADDEKYIIRLVGQVVRVSVETVKIVNALPDDFGAPK